MERYSISLKYSKHLPPKSTPPPSFKNSYFPQIGKITQTPSFPSIKGKRNLSSPPIKGTFDQISDTTRNSEITRLIGMDDFIITRVLGKGSYGTVRLGINRTTNENFAIKTYEKTKLKSNQSKKNLKTEIKILKFLDHSRIVKLFEIRESPLNTHLVLEFVNGCSLEDYVKHRKKLDEYEAIGIFKQVLSAISYCHSLKIAHRDIKLGNILINSHKKIKIIDFGFATHTVRQKKLNLNCGTPNYMAPEIVMKRPHDPLKSDMWALGVSLYVMLTGEEPFKGRNQKEVYRKITVGLFSLPKNLGSGAIGLIKNLMQADPQCRISASDALQDSWLNSFSTEPKISNKVTFDKNFLLSDNEEESKNTFDRKMFGDYIRDRIFKL